MFQYFSYTLYIIVQECNFKALKIPAFEEVCLFCQRWHYIAMLVTDFPKQTKEAWWEWVLR